MLKNDRLKYILDYLKVHHTAKVGFFSNKLNVTPETIRRDLEYLEKQGEVKRVHGGVMLNKEDKSELKSSVRESINRKEKEWIAITAAKQVNEGDFIAMDVSTTNTEIAKKLVKQFNQLSILTNSIVIATILSENVNFEIFIPNGKLKNSELGIVGASAVSYIGRFHIDTFFMSVSGVTLTKGLTDHANEEFDVKMAMYEHSIRRFAVADHTKFGKTGRFRIGDVKMVDGIITDPLISSEVVQEFADKDVPLLYSTT